MDSGVYAESTNEEELLKVYQEHFETIQGCENVECYKQALLKSGSELTRENLQKISNDALEQTFQLDKNKAADFLKGKDYYLSGQDIQGNTATLVIKHKQHPGYTSTAYFVKENGEWKIGKARTNE